MSQFYLDMMGFEWVVEIDYRVTSYGCSAQTYGPPENCWPAEEPEWEVESITLYRDEGKDVITPSFEATGALFDVLCEHFDDKIAETICEDGPPEPDYDDWRE
jgi:hypothetical protein